MIGKASSLYTHDGTPKVVEGTAGQPQYSGRDHSFTLQTIMELQKSTGQLTTAVEALKNSTEKQFESQKELFATKEDLANQSRDIHEKLARFEGISREAVANSEKGLRETITGSEKGLRETIAGSEKGLRETITNTERDLREAITNTEKDLREAITGSEKGLRETITNTERDLREAITNTEKDLREAITNSEKNLHQAITDSFTKMDEKRSGHYRWLITIIAGLFGSALVAGTILATNLLSQ